MPEDPWAAERMAANARNRAAALKLTHIAIDGDPLLVACGEDQLPGMRVGTRADVVAADDDGCWACVDAWDEAAYITGDLRAKGLL